MAADDRERDAASRKLPRDRRHRDAAQVLVEQRGIRWRHSDEQKRLRNGRRRAGHFIAELLERVAEVESNQQLVLDDEQPTPSGIFLAGDPMALRTNPTCGRG